MKKSFMTRALATGLSLAMAFSLTAATNVTVASAASTPAMASKQFAVRVGGATKTYKASTATRKTFKISKATVGNTSKATVTVAASKKGIKVTPGTVTGSTVVKVTFKNIKTKKSTTKKYRCVVKAEIEEVKELTMTAEATGVKKIAVTFNQAVDTTTTKIVVKKGSATPAIAATTPATDAKSYEVAMGTKLTAGTYTVEATVGEKVLTADITVKDEAMTAFQLVSSNLVAKPNSSAAATISYKAVNQYGEPMAASNVKATCSFGTVNEGDSKTPTADKSGTVVVENIPSTLAIEGQTGTLVLVNQENGVNLNETVTYRSKAVAGAANVLGIYDDKTEKVIEGNIKVGATVSQYKILVNIQDQYGSDMSVEDIANSLSDVSLNPASVLTDLTIDDSAKTITGSTKGSFTEVTYEGKTCIAIPLKVTGGGSSIKKAGTLSLTMVGANKGVLATPSFTVDDVVLIQSFSVSASDTIYEGTKTKLIVDAVDVNGNAVTKYDELKAAFQNLDSHITLEKNADGTGTFYYEPKNVFSTSTQKKNTSLPVTKMFYANEPTSGKYIVKPVSFTVYEAKVPAKVASVANDAITAVAVSSGAILALDMNKVTFEDQYSNTMKYSDVTKSKVTAFIGDNKVFNETNAVATIDGNDKLKFTSNGTKGNARLYLKYQTSDAGGDNKAASAENYDISVTLSAVDVSGVTAGDLTLKVNDGRMIYGADKIAVVADTEVKTVNTVATSKVQTASAIVTAKVGGKNVVIPTDKYTIIEGAELGGYKAVGGSEKVAEKTEEKTVTIVFGDEGTERVSTKVTVSNADAKATEIKKADSTDIASISATELFKAIKIMDQYGNQITGKENNVVYTVTFTGQNADSYQKNLKKNGTQQVSYDASSLALASGATASVTYSYSGLTFTTDVKFI